MSTAVIMTGHARTFATCIHTFKWHVARHYADPSFYVSTVRDEDSAGMEPLLRKLFPSAPVYIEQIEAQPNIPEPAEPVRFEPYARSVPVQAVLRQLWQNERGWELYKRTATVEAKTFIRVRPDLYFHSLSNPPLGDPFPHTAFTPKWGRFGGVNDRFAIMGRAAAEYYLTAFSYMPTAMSAGCPLHPESLVMAAMELRGCNIDDSLSVQFSTWRKDGQHRPPEIMAVDLLDA